MCVEVRIIGRQCAGTERNAVAIDRRITSPCADVGADANRSRVINHQIGARRGDRSSAVIEANPAAGKRTATQAYIGSDGNRAGVIDRQIAATRGDRSSAVIETIPAAGKRTATEAYTVSDEYRACVNDNHVAVARGCDLVT